MPQIANEAEALGYYNEHHKVTRKLEFDKAVPNEFATEAIGMQVWHLSPGLDGSVVYIAADGTLFNYGVLKRTEEQAKQALIESYKQAKDMTQ